MAATVPQLDNVYSVEMWAKNELPNDARPVTGYLFSRGVNGAEGAPGDSMGIGGTHSNSGELFVFNGNRRDEVMFGKTRIQPGSWSHLVMVRQNETVKLYLNGDPNPEIEGKLSITYPAGCDSLLLGGRNDNFANLQGMLEEVAIYDRALRPDEVHAHFEAAGVKPAAKRVEDRPARHGRRTERQDRPAPTDATKALGTMRVPDGFELQFVAAEPLVIDPAAIDWGVPTEDAVLADCQGLTANTSLADNRLFFTQ